MVKLDIYGQNLQFPIADEEFSCCLAYVLFGTRSLALRSLFTRFIKKMCACIFGIFYSYLYPRCGAVNHRVRQAGAGDWSWSGVREKYCYLAGGWRLVLEECEREIL